MGRSLSSRFQISAIATLINDVFGAVFDLVEKDANVLPEDTNREQLHASKENYGCHDGAPAGLSVAETADFTQ